jgi:membrane protein DedA with SNARE-associated domain
VVIPFAAYKAAEGDLNVFLVVLVGTTGALIGAVINYYLALYLGRPLVYKFADSTLGKMLLLQRTRWSMLKNILSETAIFNLHREACFGCTTAYSIPAVLANMSMRDFIIYTTAGAGIWNIILALIGYYIYDLKDKIFPYIDNILIVLGILFVGYLVFKGIRRRNSGK